MSTTKLLSKFFDALIQVANRCRLKRFERVFFYGPLDTLIRVLNDNDNWREIFGKKHSRLKDMELILRFIALRESHASYRSPMPKFLDDFMEDNRDMSAERLDSIKSRFERVSDVVVHMIGKEKFRSGNTLTVSRFDAVMAGVDAYLEVNAEPNREAVLQKLDELEQDNEYKWSVEEFVNDTDRVRKRITRARDIFGS